MKVEINEQKSYLKPEIILRYLITENDEINTLIMCKSSEVGLVVTDYDLYEALGSVKPYDNFKLNKLTKLLEVAELISKGLDKKNKVLKEERVEELRALALKNNNMLCY